MATFLKTTEISIDSARTLPREYYVSPEIFSEELEHIFLRRWLCVGREDRLAAPGDYLVQEIGKESVIVLKERDGAYRAFYNVCRHRGTRLCEEHTGNLGGRIQCPYHAWTYGLDGRLIGAPSTQEIEHFNKADWPLCPVAVATWDGVLFSNLAEQPEPFDGLLVGHEVQSQCPLQHMHCVPPNVQSSPFVEQLELSNG